MMVAMMKDLNPPRPSPWVVARAGRGPSSSAARSPGRRVNKDPDTWRALFPLSWRGAPFSLFRDEEAKT
jgi:hypothetical protein